MKCQAQLRIASDTGDQSATMVCGLEADHLGPHEERYPREDAAKTVVIVIWHGDDRQAADKSERKKKGKR